MCVDVGSRYGEEYVFKLFRMLKRHASGDFRFICFTDKPSSHSSEFEVRDCSEWQVTGWFNKLKLFDRKVLDEPFLYLDISLVVKSDVEPFFQFAEAEAKDLVGVRDFYYDCFNSSVMLVHPSDFTQGIWDDYAKGTRYARKTSVDGDQDFIDAHLSAKQGWPKTAAFPTEWIASYKVLRRLHVRDRAKEAAMLGGAKIVKFHGQPKMHELLNPMKSFRLNISRPLRFLWYWRYLASETRDWWR